MNKLLFIFSIINLFTNIYSDTCNEFMIWCEKSKTCINLFDNCECMVSNCNLSCDTGFKKDTFGCDTCECNEICPIIYEECNDYVCPKVTELSSCLISNLNGYTTYLLSLVLNENSIARNVYAIFGDEANGPQPMIIPPAYQIDNIFGSNLGGISEQILTINPNSKYDSWLTIGITDGDLDNKVSTVGIDFNDWSLTNGLNILNGAVFLMNPEEIIVKGNEYVIGQLTVPNNPNLNIVVNAQGKKKVSSDAWAQFQIEFILNSNNNIPLNCEIWFDGCNSCTIINNHIDICTDLECKIESTSHCLRYITEH